MSPADRPTLGDVDQAVRDAEDVFIVVEAVLCAELAPLSAMHRDALATVLRLGRDKVARAREDIEAMTGGGR